MKLRKIIEDIELDFCEVLVYLVLPVFEICDRDALVILQDRFPIG